VPGLAGAEDRGTDGKPALATGSGSLATRGRSGSSRNKNKRRRNSSGSAREEDETEEDSCSTVSAFSLRSESDESNSDDETQGDLQAATGPTLRQAFLDSAREGFRRLLALHLTAKAEAERDRKSNQCFIVRWYRRIFQPHRAPATKPRPPGAVMGLCGGSSSRSNDVNAASVANNSSSNRPVRPIKRPGANLEPCGSGCPSSSSSSKEVIQPATQAEIALLQELTRTDNLMWTLFVETQEPELGAKLLPGLFEAADQSDSGGGGGRRDPFS